MPYRHPVGCGSDYRPARRTTTIPWRTDNGNTIRFTTAIAGGIGGITACETGDSSGEADGVAVVRAAIGSRCIILRAGR